MVIKCTQYKWVYKLSNCDLAKSACILTIVRERFEKYALVLYVQLGRKLGSQKYGIISEFVGHK